MENRVSVRAFMPERLKPEVWERLMRAAMSAPSAVNKQPWEFIIIENRKTLKALASALPYAKMTAEAGGALLACALPAKAYEGKTAFAIIDVSLACQNFLLAAQAESLGAVWTALYPEPEREAAVRSLLGIPENVIPLALIPVGIPDEHPAPKHKYDPAKIHRDRW